MEEHKGTRRVARMALKAAIFALVIVMTGVLLGRFDLIPKQWGLFAMMAGAVLAGLGTIAALGALGLNARNKAGVGKTALIALVLAGGYSTFMAGFVIKAGKVPPIHDVSTDLTNPPAFKKLSLRADNLAGVETVGKWHSIHRAAYGDIKPVNDPRTPAEVIEAATRLAKAQGWAIALSDPAGGRLEATASVSAIRYQDDIVVIATPAAEGAGSVVNMRSVSRIGVSDLGMNAKRIREFLTALAAGL